MSLGSADLVTVHAADRRDDKREGDRAEQGKNEKQIHGWGSFFGSVTRYRCRSRADPLVMDRHWGAQPGPVPQESAVGVREPEAAV